MKPSGPVNYPDRVWVPFYGSMMLPIVVPPPSKEDLCSCGCGEPLDVLLNLGYAETATFNFNNEADEQ
jgi:hypothetical protein